MIALRRAAVVALALTAALLLFPASPASSGNSTATPTPTADPPLPLFVDPTLLEQIRIVNAFDCGGDAERCMWQESDAMVMARIAMGEAPDSINDRIYIMWNIRMRAELGFGGSAYYSGSRSTPDAWGPSTTIKEEALCDGGCQFSPARAASNVYFPCALSEGNPMRAMLCPTDDQLPGFLMTYAAADYILRAPLSEMPVELRGYDGFRSPQVSWVGRIDHAGGLRSRRFFPNGNIWRDEYEKDNVFWERVALRGTATPTPTITPTPRPTRTLLPPEKSYATLQLDDGPVVIREENRDMRKPYLFIVVLAVLALSFVLMAFQVINQDRVAEVIAGVVTFIIMLFGPKPLKALYDLLKLPGGAWRVFATYVMSFLVGLAALLITGAFASVTWNLETLMAFAGALATAAQMAYHRLKDLGSI